MKSKRQGGVVLENFVYNDIDNGINVAHELKRGLATSSEFWFSVAFITKGGIQYLKRQLIDLENRGIHGRILTTTFLQFNDPDALLELLKFKNLEIRVTEENLHTKGYMFTDKESKKSFLIGSSNLTMNALKANLEWNVRTSQEKIITDAEEEFEKIWKNSAILTEAWVEGYRRIYRQREALKTDPIVNLEGYRLEPNKMQASALEALCNLRSKGENKGLLISATGTGKTYLSAFDVREAGAKKVLFIAHRETILKQARASYSKVLPQDKKMCILSGSMKDKQTAANFDVVFATVQTMSKDEILSIFSKEHFDYIVIDETHRAAAQTYKKVIGYFSPGFLLGMTATPERTDNLDIYKLYDHNIAYEIRLQDAMRNNLLCPFCYFGITDIEIDGEAIDDKTEFNTLVSEERIRHIVQKIELYGYSGSTLRGLMFCSNIKEAKEISEKLNTRGYKTVALTGSDKEEYREDCIALLEEGRLDYIITVDIFNEGVDIPSVNQVVMLRPTQSAIIFVQQLGRGLRKIDGKEFVTVIDFIGNYENNYMIPIALSGKKSGKKYELRRFIRETDAMVAGLCNVEFDRIITDKIYASIDKVNMNSVKSLRADYNRLKTMLGRVPDILDFEKYDIMDPLRLTRKYKNYNKAIRALDKTYEVEFDEVENLMLDIICQKVINGKRRGELEILQAILDDRPIPKLDSLLLESCLTVLSGEFETTKDARAKFKGAEMVKEGRGFDCNLSLVADEDSSYIKTISPTSIFLEKLENPDFKKEVQNLVDFGMYRNRMEYSDIVEKDLCLYKSYSYEDVCRLLRWKDNLVSLNIGGYKFDEYTKTFPVFVNYDKDESISESIRYEDRFVDKETFIAISKNNRTLESKDIKTIYSAKKEEIKIYLFLRKDTKGNETKEFYFLGEVETEGTPIQKGKVVEIKYRLKHPVKDSLYEYFVEV